MASTVLTILSRRSVCGYLYQMLLKVNIIIWEETAEKVKIEGIGGRLNHGMGSIVLTILFVFLKLWSPCLPWTCMPPTHQYLFTICLFAYSYLLEMLLMQQFSGFFNKLIDIDWLNFTFVPIIVLKMIAMVDVLWQRSFERLFVCWVFVCLLFIIVFKMITVVDSVWQTRLED